MKRREQEADATDAADDIVRKGRLSRLQSIPNLPQAMLAQIMGEGKAFHGGPVCHLNGKGIPPFVTNSESGGITPVNIGYNIKTLR